MLEMRVAIGRMEMLREQVSKAVKTYRDEALKVARSQRV